MFEQKCIRRWGAQRTIQLCKHAATSFPQLLQDCTETSHCLNSAHSIPVPGPQPAAASSLQACLPAWPETDTVLTTARVIHNGQRAFMYAKLDSSTKNALDLWPGYLNAESTWTSHATEISYWKKRQLSRRWGILPEILTPPVMTRLEIYLYWYLKYEKCGSP